MENKNTLQTEKRYYTLSTYNRVRILEQIKKMIISDGGTILQYKHAKAIEINLQTFDATKEQRAKLKTLPPLVVCSLGYGCPSLHYIKNGFYYYIGYDDNPFFPIVFNKIKIDENGVYYGKRYLYSNEPINEKSYKKTGALALSLGYDDIFKICDDEQIKDLAEYHYNQIKNVIENGAESETDSEKKRVQNYYNNGWHYETILDRSKRNIFDDLTTEGAQQ